MRALGADGREPVQPFSVDGGGVPMSGLMCRADDPHAVIVAFHGGATTSRYFDPAGRQRLSLLRTGAALGYTVVALDRPGYGDSAGRVDPDVTPDERVDLVCTAIGRLFDGRPQGAGFFVFAHSNGCELALRVAGAKRGDGLLGLELSGTGREYHADAAGILGRWGQDDMRPPGGARGVRSLLWEPEHLYPPEIVGGSGLTASGPGYELDVVKAWVEDFPGLAAQVRVPVHFTIAEHERVWRADVQARDDIESLFPNSPRVVMDSQVSGGHNLSVGWAASAYHLKVLSFVEECVLRRPA